MPTESFEVFHVLPARPERIYNAWLDGDEHGRFTGGGATVDPMVGGSFTAWDGYIVGKNLVLEPHRRIVQSWRSTDFPEGAPDSKLELLLDEEGNGTRITLRHSNLPEGQGKGYQDGWSEHYFVPMTRYFAKAGSRFEGAGEALSDAAGQARAAIEQAGEQAQAAFEAAGAQAGKAMRAVKKTAKKAAKKVQALAKKAQKLATRSKKAAPKKAAKKKAAPKKKAAKKKSR
ncbi:MAG: SRPBCC domain-containing protein [Myxococcaceae bacterium]